MQVHLSYSYMGPSSSLGIVPDPTSAATSVQESASRGFARVNHPIPAAPALRSMGVGINVSASA
jgi:hypothetical protein